MVFNNLKKCHSGSIFSTKSKFTPAVATEVIDDNGDVYTDMEPISKTGKKHLRYLPGERLLLKLKKDRIKQRDKDSMKKNNVKIQEIDVDSISKSISRLMSSFEN